MRMDKSGFTYENFEAFNFTVLGLNRAYHTIFLLSNNIKNLISAATTGITIVPLANS
jgi:hypothetical protein